MPRLSRPDSARLATRVGDVAEALAPESIAARLAEVREQLKLLADYL